MVFGVDDESLKLIKASGEWVNYGVRKLKFILPGPAEGIQVDTDEMDQTSNTLNPNENNEVNESCYNNSNNLFLSLDGEQQHSLIEDSTLTNVLQHISMGSSTPKAASQQKTETSVKTLIKESTLTNVVQKISMGSGTSKSGEKTGLKVNSQNKIKNQNSVIQGAKTVSPNKINLSEHGERTALTAYKNK